jgi:hypothetical protein
MMGTPYENPTTNVALPVARWSFPWAWAMAWLAGAALIVISAWADVLVAEVRNRRPQLDWAAVAIEMAFVSVETLIFVWMRPAAGRAGPWRATFNAFVAFGFLVATVMPQVPIGSAPFVFALPVFLLMAIRCVAGWFVAARDGVRKWRARRAAMPMAAD